jgi:hypothetical protein
MARKDLSVEDVERMGKEEPGSAARYLEERRAELEAEEQKRREEDDKQRFIEQFVAAGGNRADAPAEWKKLNNEKAATATRQAEEAASIHTRRRISRAL